MLRLPGGGPSLLQTNDVRAVLEMFFNQGFPFTAVMGLPTTMCAVRMCSGAWAVGRAARGPDSRSGVTLVLPVSSLRAQLTFSIQPAVPALHCPASGLGLPGRRKQAAKPSLSGLDVSNPLEPSQI